MSSKHLVSKRLLTSLLLALYLLAHTMVVSALSPDQKNIYKNQVFYYDATVENCNATAITVTLAGSDNVEKAFNFFVTQGYSPVASAGIVGNLILESGVDPTRYQGGGDTQSPPMKVVQPPSGTLGWGIAQWSTLDQQQQLVSKGGSNVADIGFQLGFLNNQLNSNPTYYKVPELKAATDPIQAADIFEQGFERAGKPALAEREQYASQVFLKYGNNGVSPAGVTSPIATSGNCTSSNGTQTSFADGFTFYLQCDPAWAQFPYGNAGLCANGCGPTSMAMAITNLTHAAVPPDQTASYAKQVNDVMPDGSSKWSISPDLAKHWNLKSAPVNSVAQMSAALQTGGLVILAGQGSAPFTSGGHFILLRGIASDGKWLIADPASGKNSQTEWDPQALIAAGYHSGSAYALGL